MPRHFLIPRPPAVEEKVESRFVAFSISSDDGITWSESVNLRKNADPKIHSVIRHSIVELSPDSWLLPLADRTVLYNPKTGLESPMKLIFSPPTPQPITGSCRRRARHALTLA